MIEKVSNWVMAWGVAEWTLVVGILSVVVGILSAHIAVRLTHKFQTSLVEPWTISKIDDEHWLLERTHPKLATVWSVEVSPNRKSYSTAYIPPETVFLKKGTKALIKLAPPPEKGSTIYVRYVTHARSNSRHASGYAEEFASRNADLDVPPRRVKTWANLLY